MRAILALVIAALVLKPVLLQPAGAQPIHLYGTLGTRAVFIDLNQTGDTLSGWYLYLRAGKEIRLEGKLDRHGFFQLDEYTASSNSHTGSFTGRATGGRWRGNWQGTSAKTRTLDLSEVHGALKSVTATIHCTARRTASDYDLRSSQTLDLALAKGRVTHFAMRRHQYDDTRQESCKIADGAMLQQPSPVGILLKAKADRTSAARHCSIRLFQAGDYVILRSGDPRQSGDDCRGAGRVRFCTENGLWADLVINRKTSQCLAVQ